MNSCARKRTLSQVSSKSLVSNAEIIFRLETAVEGWGGERRVCVKRGPVLLTGSQKATFKTNKPGLRSRLLTEGSDLEEKKQKTSKRFLWEVGLGTAI